MSGEKMVSLLVVSVVSGLVVYWLTRPKVESGTRVTAVAGLRG